MKSNPSFDWESLKDNTAFATPQPSVPALQTLPVEPSRTEPQYTALPFRVTIKFVDWIVPGARRKKLVSAQAEEGRRKAGVQDKYLRAHARWKQRCDEMTQQNEAALSNHEKAKATWLLERHVFLEQQKLFNVNIRGLQAQYLNRNPDALIRYWSEIIERSEYPDAFPQDHVLSFDSQAGILVLDYELPPEAAVPKKKLVRYVAQRKEFQDVFISDIEFRRLYDDVLYQICLRTLYELFRADELNVITSIVFNGWVHAVNKATGADTHPCIMTVQAAKTDFLALNLQQIDLKTCFRSLKGVSGGRLIDFSPVRPVLSLDKNDPRFVGAYGVAESLDDKTNLAAMDWLDFENLIREVFEKEFSKNGGEVKITQASRDGGVDAIAFDPDPLRGGKIVIQAKRYTNTVGVSAVRDLYGTVHNEGANKGILVTTSDYGPDAYEFAKGKPLTLLTGSQLLYLLSQHGYQAKIDLQEAKKLLGDQ